MSVSLDSGWVLWLFWWIEYSGRLREPFTTAPFLEHLLLDSSHHAAAAAKSLQSCPTLCDPIDGSPPGSSMPRVLQARILEWVAIFFSNAWKWKVKVKLLSRVRPSATPWTAAFQAPPSMGFSRQEYWGGVPCYKKLNHTKQPGARRHFIVPAEPYVVLKWYLHQLLVM